MIFQITNIPWEKFQPNNHRNADCVILYKNKTDQPIMDDLSCRLHYGFICETYAGKIQQIMKTFLRSKKTIKYKKKYNCTCDFVTYKYVIIRSAGAKNCYASKLDLTNSARGNYCLTELKQFVSISASLGKLWYN